VKASYPQQNHVTKIVLGEAAGYNELCQLLAMQRIALGMTQRELDQLAGFQDGYTGKLETGTRPKGRTIGSRLLPMWLGALGVRLAIVPIDEHE